MKSPTKSSYWGERSPLRQVDFDPSHYRSGRWVLLAQGVVLSAVGVAGLVASSPHDPPGGAPVLVLRLTPLHSGALLVFGIAALAAVPWRRATHWVTALSLIASGLAFAIGVTAATNGPDMPWGFDFADAWLHGALVAIDLGLLIWLLPDELQDPGWVRKRRDSTESSGKRAHEPANHCETST